MAQYVEKKKRKKQQKMSFDAEFHEREFQYQTRKKQQQQQNVGFQKHKHTLWCYRPTALISPCLSTIHNTMMILNQSVSALYLH